MAQRMRKIMGLLAIALVAAACSSTATIEPAAPDDVSDDVTVDDTSADIEVPDSVEAAATPIDRAKLLDTLAEWEREVEGGGIVYVRNADGQFDAAAIGDDAETGEPLDVDDQVRVGSISKVITAVLVLQLVDEGLVDLDAPVSTYVDGLGLANDVSIRELLGHRSGIPNYTESRGFFEVVMADPDSEPSPGDLVSYVGDESDFDPDTQFAYSNTNFVVAGMVIEVVRGQTLNEALDEFINTPLGLTQTTFADGTLANVVSGHSAMVRSGTSTGQSYRSVAYGSWAAGGLVTTVGELATLFDGIFLGNLIGSESLDEMLGDLDDGAEYGLGLHPGADFGVGHGGSIVGFNSMAQIDLDTNELVIAVVNNDMRSPSVLTAKLTNFIRQ